MRESAIEQWQSSGSVEVDGRFGQLVADLEAALDLARAFNNERLAVLIACALNEAMDGWPQNFVGEHH
jgi:hypothetical protein